MAIHVFAGSNCPTVSFNSVDLTDHVRSVTLSMSAEDVDITPMGATSRAHAPGLRDDYVEVEFFQDYASAKVDQTLYAYVGSSTGAALVVKPTNASVATSNPSYTMTAIILDYQPIDGTVGEASTTTVRFVPAAGSSITRATM